MTSSSASSGYSSDEHVSGRFQVPGAGHFDSAAYTPDQRCKSALLTDRQEILIDSIYARKAGKPVGRSKESGHWAKKIIRPVEQLVSDLANFTFTPDHTQIQPLLLSTDRGLMKTREESTRPQKLDSDGTRFNDAMIQDVEVGMLAARDNIKSICHGLKATNAEASAFQSLLDTCTRLDVEGAIQATKNELWSLSELNRLVDAMDCCVKVRGRIVPVLEEHMLNDAVCVVTKELLLILPTCPKSLVRTACVLSRQQLLAMRDTAHMRYGILMAATLLGEIDPELVPTPATLRKLFSWGDDILCNYGRLGYEPIKCFEPLMVGSFLSRYDILPRRKEFLAFMRREFIGSACFKPQNGQLETRGTIFCTVDENVGRRRAIHLLQDLDAIVKDVKGPTLFAELFGLHRAWGFPTINEQKSFGKTRAYGKADFAWTPRTEMVLQDVLGALKRQYTLDHVRQHHIAPPMDSLPKSPVLQRWCSTVHDVNELAHGRSTLSEWSSVDHGHKFKFDYHVNNVQGVDDKAISAEASAWDATRHESVRGYELPEPEHRTRLIEELLMRKNFSAEEVLKRIMNRAEESLPKEWFSCGLKSKERDMSLVSRLYGILYLEIRTYFTLTEANLADGIFRYFPQQTMTLSESELTHRLTAMDNTGGRNVNYAVVNVVLDFLKWNLHFCDENTRAVFEWLDKLYGTPNLFTFSHECFHQMIMYLRSTYYADKELDEGTRLAMDHLESMYYGHKRGIEGLRQKGWTLFTLGLLLMVAHRRGVRVHLTGQGDNQNLKIWVPLPDGISSEQAEESHREYIQAFLDDFCQELDQAALDVGLPLRLTETWQSYFLSIYGKEWVYQSGLMPMCLKRFSRVQEDVNGIVQDVTSRLSTLWAAALSCPQKGCDVMVPYIIAGGLSWAVLQRAYRVNPVHPGLPAPAAARAALYTGTALSLARGYLLMSPSIGGLVAVPFLSFLMRGFPDDLTETLFHLWICTQGSGPSKDVATRIYSALTSGSSGFTKSQTIWPLTENPVGTHVRAPRSVAHEVKDTIENALRSDGVKNEAIKMMFESWITDEGEKLVEALSRVRPRAPRFIADTVGAHYLGEQQSFLGKFDSAVTVLRCCNVGWDFLADCGEIAQGELIHHHNRLVRLSSHRKFEHLPRPAALAQGIREVCWGTAQPHPETPQDAVTRRLFTVVDITLPYPLEQFEFRDVSPKFIKMREPHIVATVDFTPGFANPITDRAVLTRGHGTALMSSSTSENKTGRIIPVAHSDGAVRKGCRLRAVTGPWVAPDKQSALRKFMDILANLRNDLSFDESTLRVGGDAQGAPGHRLNDAFTSHGVALNIRGYVSSMVHLDSEEINLLCDALEELMYLVQGVYFLLIGFISLKALYTHKGMDRSKETMIAVARGYLNEVRVDESLWPRAHLGQYKLHGPIPLMRKVEKPRWFFASRHEVVKDSLKVGHPGRFGRCVSLDSPSKGMLEHAEAWSLFNAAKPMAAVNIYPSSVPVVKLRPAVKIRRMASSVVGRVIKMFAWRVLREILPGVVFSVASAYLGTVMAHCLRVMQSWTFSMWEQIVGCPGVYDQIIELLGGCEATASSLFSALGSAQAIKEIVSCYLMECERTGTYEFLEDHLFFYLREDEMMARFPDDLMYMVLLCCLEMKVPLRVMRGAYARASAACQREKRGNDLEASCYEITGVFKMVLREKGCGWAAEALKIRLPRMLYTVGDVDAWTFCSVFDYVEPADAVAPIGGGCGLLCDDFVSIPHKPKTPPLFAASVVLLSKEEPDCLYEAHAGHAGNRGFRSDLLVRGRGTFSSAPYKLLDLLISRSVVKSRVVLLGEWPAGWLEMLLADPACFLAYFMSRTDPAEVTPGKLCSRVPPCVVGSPGYKAGKLRGLRYSQGVSDDLRTESCAKATIDGLLEIADSTWTFFASDIFITGSATLEDMLNAAITLGRVFSSTSAPEGLMVIKLMTSHQAVADATLQVLGHYCTPERVVITRFSSPENTESYVWCRKSGTPPIGLSYFPTSVPRVALSITRRYDCPRLSMMTPDQRLIDNPMSRLNTRPAAEIMAYVEKRYPWRGPRVFAALTNTPCSSVPKDHRDFLEYLKEVERSLKGAIAERLVALGAKNSHVAQSAGRRWLVKGYAGCEGISSENTHMFCLLVIWDFVLCPPKSAVEYNFRLGTYIRNSFDIQLRGPGGSVTWGVGVSKRDYLRTAQRAVPLILAWALQDHIATWEAVRPESVKPARFCRNHSSALMLGDQVRQPQSAVDAAAVWCRETGVSRWMDVAAGTGAISCAVARLHTVTQVVAYSKEPDVREMQAEPKVHLVRRWSTASDVRERALGHFEDGLQAEGLILDPPWWSTAHFMKVGCGQVVSSFLNAGGIYVICSAGPGYPGLPVDLLPCARFRVSGTQFYCYKNPRRQVIDIPVKVFAPSEDSWLQHLEEEIPDLPDGEPPNVSADQHE